MAELMVLRPPGQPVRVVSRATRVGGRVHVADGGTVITLRERATDQEVTSAVRRLVEAELGLTSGSSAEMSLADLVALYRDHAGEGR